MLFGKKKKYEMFTTFVFENAFNEDNLWEMVTNDEQLSPYFSKIPLIKRIFLPRDISNDE